MNVTPSLSLLEQFALTPPLLQAPALAYIEIPYAQFHSAPQLFAPFANEPWAQLLDSADAQHPNSRFDILLRQPQATLTTQNEQTELAVAVPPSFALQPHASLTIKQAAPLALLATWQQAVPRVVPAAEVAHLPFHGGFSGLFGYDLGRSLERIPAHAQADITQPDIAVGRYFHALIIDHERQQSWIIHPAEQTMLLRCGNASAQQPLRQVAESFWQLHQASPVFAPFSLTSPWRSNLTAAEYHHRIDRIHAYLRAGDCYQINLAQRFQAQYQGHPWLAYLALRQANQAPFSAYLQLPSGSILSVSPERFLHTTATGVVSTRPIKGTRPRRANATADAEEIQALQNSSKDQAENLMIVDLLRNDISRVCLPGSVRVPELFKIESFHAVHHLVSTVTGRLSPQHSPFSLLAATFPGGSITGAPKIRAMEIIEELEPHRRSAYCGSIGYFSMDGQSDTSITIRTLVCEQNNIYCWAGGGIVIDSVAAAEYQETHDKVAKILPVLTALANSE